MNQQFVDDYLLVVENDREAWDDIIQMARAENYNMPAISDIIKEGYETMVSDVIGAVKEELPEAAINLLSQMLFGWGLAEFDAIARRVIEADKEALGD